MVPINPFYVQPKRPTRYVPRSTSEGVAGAPRRFEVPPMSVPPMSVPPRYPDPPSKGMFFFDDQHRKWREQEAKIQQAAECAMPRIGARRSTAARPRTSPSSMHIGPSGGAHPLTSPPSSRLPESIPWPGIGSEIPAPRHGQRMPKRLSSPSPPVREHKNTHSCPTSTVHVNRDPNGPPQAPSPYPYPSSSQTQQTNYTSPQIPLSRSGAPASPKRYSTRSRRPPPLNFDNNVSQQSFHSMTSPFSPIKALTRFNPFSRSKSEPYDPLVDEEQRRACERLGKPSGSKKSRG